MSLPAKIMYPYEIEDVKKSGALAALPVVAHLFSIYPKADPRAILHTVEEHVKMHGLDVEYPNEIIVPDYLRLVTKETVKPVSSITHEDEAEDSIAWERNTPAIKKRTERESAPARRTLKKRTAKPSDNSQNVNFRGLMDDIDALDL